MSANPFIAALSNVEIRFPQLQLIAFTDQNGNFTWQKIDRVNGWIYFKKGGYYEDSLFIDWQGKKELSIQHQLYKMPSLNYLKVFSVIVNNYSALKESKVTIRAEFAQPYLDIDSVLVLNKALNFRASYVLNNKAQFEVDYSTEQLKLPSINGVIGHPFEIQVLDTSGRQVFVGSDMVERIITDEVIFISPVNAQVVHQQPELQWQVLQPGFRFTYMVEVYAFDFDDFIVQLEWARSGISSNDTTVTVGTLLDPGDHFWVIWCVDEFNNRSRSKPASFKVE